VKEDEGEGNGLTWPPETMKSSGVLKFFEKEQREKRGCNTRTFQEVTHPSTTLAQARLTAEF
jgi:hypothetical protein